MGKFVSYKSPEKLFQRALLKQEKEEKKGQKGLSRKKPIADIYNQQIYNEFSRLGQGIAANFRLPHQMLN